MIDLQEPEFVPATRDYVAFVGDGDDQLRLSATLGSDFGLLYGQYDE